MSKRTKPSPPHEDILTMASRLPLNEPNTKRKIELLETRAVFNTYTMSTKKLTKLGALALLAAGPVMAEDGSGCTVGDGTTL